MPTDVYDYSEKEDLNKGYWNPKRKLLGTIILKAVKFKAIDLLYQIEALVSLKKKYIYSVLYSAASSKSSSALQTTQTRCQLKELNSHNHSS